MPDLNVIADACTTRAAAERLGVSLRTVQLWVEAGALSAWKTPGGHRRVLNTSIDALLLKRNCTSPKLRHMESPQSVSTSPAMLTSHHTDTQSEQLARDLSRMRANYAALLLMSDERPRIPSSLATTRHLTILLQLHDFDHYRHAIRVARLSSILAHGMGMDDTDALMLELAAPFHDVGVLAYSDKHPGPASHESHTTLGESILQSDDRILALAARIARSHHEHFDGNGFPDRQAGDRIPLEARIVAVADHFNELLFGADGRHTYTPHEACHAVRMQSGKRFDPKVVDALEQGLSEYLAVIESDLADANNKPALAAAGGRG